MAGLIFANNPTPQERDDPNVVTSGDWWPSVNLADIRAQFRIDDTVTAPRLRQAVIEAVQYTNAQLAAFRLANPLSGSLKDIPGVDIIDGKTRYEILYLRAVACYTKAELLETYADFDATAKAGARAEAKQDQAADYLRRAHAAIADMIGARRVDCELI